MSGARTYPVRQAAAEAAAPQTAAPLQPMPQSPVAAGPAMGPEVIGPGEIVEGGYPGPVYGDGMFAEGAACGMGGCATGACGYGGDCAWDYGSWWGPLQGYVWARADYLLWWSRGMSLPPLVSTGPLPDTVLFGDTRVNEDARSGVRVNTGFWIDPCQTYGIEATWLWLNQDSEQFQGNQISHPNLARPFFDVNPDPLFYGPSASLIASPGLVQGEVTATATTEFGLVDVLYRQGVWQQCGFRMDGLLGYRYARLDEDVRIHEFKTALVTSQNPPVPAGTTVDITDRFHALNEFNGAVFGVEGKWRWCRWSFDGLLKLGLGATTNHVSIDGSTVFTLPGQAPTAPQPGGVLAQPHNIGLYRSSSFAVMPEIGVTLGYDLTCRLRATVGYSLLYLSGVARPGDQIDMDVNSSQFPTAAGPGTLVGLPRPEFRLKTEDFWAQGLNFGLDYRF